MPSGIFNRDAVNIVGNGAVVNPEALIKEINLVEKTIGEIKNLYISDRCHIIFPFHIRFDEYEEERLKEAKFGSTKMGIAPVYSDKYFKVGILASDLVDKDYLYKRIKNNLDYKNQIIEHIYKKPKIDVDEMVEWGYSNGKQIQKYITNVIRYYKRLSRMTRRYYWRGNLER